FRMHELAFPAARAHQLFLDLLEGHREDRLKQLVSNLANRFVGRPAIQLFGASVPVVENSVHSPHINRVMRQTEKISLLPNSLFDALARGDIADGSGDQRALLR